MGRPKGAINKTTRAVKEALTEAFEQLGGVPALKTWAESNPTAFYQLWGKMMPLQVTGEGGGALLHRVEFVIVDPAEKS